MILDIIMALFGLLLFGSGVLGTTLLGLKEEHPEIDLVIQDVDLTKTTYIKSVGLVLLGIFLVIVAVL